MRESTAIDPVAAFRLRQQHFTWTEIGRILVEREGRRMPFLATSCVTAVRKYRRQQKCGTKQNG